MTHWIDEWDLDEWRNRMPEPPDDEEDVSALERHLIAQALWMNERAIVMAARFGHDTPEMRQTWAEEIQPTKDQRGFASLLIGVAREPETSGGVLLFGNVGSGKTAAAGRGAHILREGDMATIFLKATEFMDDLRDIATSDDREVSLEKYRNGAAWAPALVIDDLGAQRSTEFSREQLTALLDARYEFAKQAPLVTVITTNLGPRELEGYLGDRAYSRLMGLVTDTFEFTGKDMRHG